MKQQKPARSRASGLLKMADSPLEGGKLPHLRIDIHAEVPALFFLPGDPARLQVFEELCDRFERLSDNREYALATGSYRGRPFGVCSTGIGGGSTEIAVIELARLGVRKLIRVGGCGALQERVRCGELVVAAGAVRMGGSSRFYVEPEFPAVADPFLATVLADCSTTRGERAHVGVVATVDSYYEGQGRSAADSRAGGWGTAFLERMQQANVLALDMETETVLTLSYLLGLRGASLLVAHGNRITNDWLADYHPAQKAAVGCCLEALDRLLAA